MSTGRDSEHHVGRAGKAADAAEQLCLGRNLSAPQVNTKFMRADGRSGVRNKVLLQKLGNSQVS